MKGYPKHELYSKNGKSVNTKKPIPEDAQSIIFIISTADTEPMFLARNLGEFCTKAEREEDTLGLRLLHFKSNDIIKQIHSEGNFERWLFGINWMVEILG